MFFCFFVQWCFKLKTDYLSLYCLPLIFPRVKVIVEYKFTSHMSSHTGSVPVPVKTTQKIITVQGDHMKATEVPTNHLRHSQMKLMSFVKNNFSIPGKFLLCPNFFFTRLSEIYLSQIWSYAKRLNLAQLYKCGLRKVSFFQIHGVCKKKKVCYFQKCHA